MKVLITGGSGLVGKLLSKALIAQGHSVVWLGRTAKKNSEPKQFEWDLETDFIDPNALEGVEGIVHLAGAGIADSRWTDARKKVLIDSRVKGLELLIKHIDKSKIKVLVSASGIGYYGAQSSPKIHTETDSSFPDFVSKICVEWERAADLFAAQHIRTVKLRIGVVLSSRGGALEKMAPPVKVGIGSPLGSGSQWMPWIHENDLVEAIAFSLTNTELEGVYNAVADEQPTNAQFMKAIAITLRKPFFFPAVPSFAMKLLFGEMAGILLEGCRVSNSKIKQAGFQFQHPDLLPALKSIL